MSRKNNIRWSNNDKSNLRKTVRNFNAKIGRLAAKSSDLAVMLPQKITQKELSAQIETRQDLNRLLNRYKRFSKKGAEKIVETKAGNVITNWELKEAQIMWNTKESIKAKKRAKLKQNEKSFTMGDIEQQNLKASKLKPADIKQGEAWRKFVKSLESQVSSNRDYNLSQRYKESYLKAIENNLGEKGQFLKDIIKQIDAQILADKYFDDPVTRIQFISDPLSADIIVQESITHWGKALGWTDEQIEEYLIEYVDEFEVEE